MKATRGTISLSIYRIGKGVFSETVDALLYPNTAVHRNHPQGEGWTVTHRLSGLSIYPSIPSQRKAQAVAKYLEGNLPVWPAPGRKAGQWTNIDTLRTVLRFALDHAGVPHRLR